jgi:hypothetical protein
MPLTAARVFAYMRLQPKPVSLDEIAAGLGISKRRLGGDAASRAGQSDRAVRRAGQQARAVRANGELRAFAVQLQSPAQQSGALLREGAAVGAGPDATARMLERSDFFLAVHEAIEARWQS